MAPRPVRSPTSAEADSSVTDGRRFYEAPAARARRSAPAALRNREPIAEVLREWLPERGLVLEVASGTGEHAVYFAEAFPDLEWQPSDVHPDALTSIAAWRDAAGLPNLREPIVLDAAASGWPIDRADAVLSINMVHISPWASALGPDRRGRPHSAGRRAVDPLWPMAEGRRSDGSEQSRLRCATSRRVTPNGACGGSRTSPRLLRKKAWCWRTLGQCRPTI